MTFRPLPCAGVVALILLAGCTTPQRLSVPGATALPKDSQGSAVSSDPSQPMAGSEDSAPRTGLRELATPSLPESEAPKSAGMFAQEPVPQGLKGEPINVNVSNLPVSTFIHEVLGNMLGVTFQVDPAVEKLTELVTLRTSEPLRPEAFYRIARQVLADYGIELQVEGKIVRVKMAPAGTRPDPPIVLSGRALPDVPLTHRPVYYLMDMQAIRSSEANRWLRTIFGEEVKAEESIERNALLISGRPDKVRQAVEAVRVFDRPFMRGRSSIRLEPSFMSAEQLAAKLTEVLVAEGYGAANTLGAAASVLVLPIQAVNTIVVFAADPKLLRHAVDWARELDRPNRMAGNNSVFYYQVRNTKAADIARILGTASIQPGTPSATATAPAPATPARTGGTAGRALIVDEPRNALVFQGDPAEWERLLPLVRQMDRETRQVMIEMTIAEVTLDDNEEFGIGWFAKGGLGRFNGNLGLGTLPATPGQAAVSGNGLTYLLDVAGQSRALLKAFADDQRVSILSTPRLMVKSGEEASIDVGTEVPTITARQTSPQQVEGSTGLLQSIQYRKTGIILSVKPTVYSDDRVDIELQQEVSEALPLSDSDQTGSPSIFNRGIKTSLSLRDGGSIMIGGLMSRRQTNSNSGVPYLKDVPVLGNLFKTQTKRKNKTELVLMIVPYIIGSDRKAEDLTQALGDQFELLSLPAPSREATPAAPVIQNPKP